MRANLKSRILTLCACALLAAFTAPAAKSAYVSFDPANSLQTYATAINSEADVAGVYFLDSYAPAAPGSARTRPSGPLTAHGFLRTPDGTITDYDVPVADAATELYALNDKGAFNGNYQSKSGRAGFIQSAKGRFTSFNPSGSTYRYPIAVNDSSVVTGFYADESNVFHGFVRAAKGAITAFDPAGSTSTLPYAINAKGLIVGYYSDANNVCHGFMRAADGTITGIDVPDATNTSAYGINTHGDIVGSYDNSSNVLHGYRRSPAGKFTTITLRHVKNNGAAGVNDTGVITGDYTKTSGATQGYVRTP